MKYYIFIFAYKYIEVSFIIIIKRYTFSYVSKQIFSIELLLNILNLIKHMFYVFYMFEFN